MKDKDLEYMKLERQLCFPLYAAARKVTNIYSKWLRPLGLTYTQYIVFLVLWEKDGLSVGEIGKDLMLDNGTLTPLLKKLEGEGYIERKRSPEDDRVVLIYLTARGRDLQEKLRDLPKKIHTCLDLPREEMEDLYVLLYKVLEKEGKKDQ